MQKEFYMHSIVIISYTVEWFMIQSLGVLDYVLFFHLGELLQCFQ